MKAAAKTVRVRCLPIAGRENPYQFLMMQGLRQDNRLEVGHGAPGKVLAVLRTWLFYRPNIIHFDWNYRYYLRKYRLLTYLSAALFLAEVFIVRYLFGCRIVWTMHNIQSHDELYAGFERIVQSRFARMCDWIHLFWQSSVPKAAAYLRVDTRKFRVLPEGSYVGYYPNEISQAESRQQLGFPSTGFVLLSLGSIRPYKGIDQLIEAFRQIDNPNWRLVIAGAAHDAAYLARIRAQAQPDSRISIRGEMIPEAELQTYYNACDVVVLPFQQVENSGSAILAMGFAKPVVAPDLGVLPERLASQSALLYKLGHLHEALASLETMSQETLQTLGQLNLQAVQRYPWENFSAFFVGE